jgi:hypothetical protein
MARKLGLTVAKGAALLVSVGIVGSLMVRASTGCSDRSDIGADPARPAPVSSAAPNDAAAETSSSPTPGGLDAEPSAEQENRIYFPATKSGAGRLPRIVESQKPAQQHAAPPPAQVQQ